MEAAVELKDAAGNRGFLNAASMHDSEGILGAMNRLGMREQVLFETSGSSGSPKFVCLSRKAIRASARAVNAFLGISESDVLLRALPRFHVGGYSVAERAVAAGASLENMDGRWNAEAFAERCGKADVTLTSLVPTQVHDIVGLSLRAPSSLRCVLVGGGALENALRSKAEALGWPVCATYGMTEAASQIATENACGALEVMPHWEARVDDGSVLAIKGPALFTGYLTSEGSDWRLDRPFEDGWFRTGDRVELEGRRLRHLGRTDSVVKVLGELVDLDDLERRLANGRAALIALPDERSGARIVLVCESGIAEPETLFRAFNEQVRGFERAQEFRIVEEIPRSSLGKVRRGVLRSLFGTLSS